ncbi:MAG: SDR family NAD(P)-dependent oxidoreductase, partial [Candidatus Korarchaeota archaeon]|nr:SDR family NAD(P)-dependent oxidoreductase [Candidatus Korarchaeota archaeon]
MDMVWRLLTYTVVLVPPEPYKTIYAAGVVVDEAGRRLVARIPAEYADVLRVGLEGEVVEEETVFGRIHVFVPSEKPREPRAVVVTGGAGGIGSEIARVFAEKGFAVAVADVDPEGARRVAGEIRASGGEALAIQMDVSDPESVARGFREIAGKLGRIRVLVNNAGLTLDASLEKMTPEKWGRVLEVNLTGAYLCSREASRYM